MQGKVDCLVLSDRLFIIKTLVRMRCHAVVGDSLLVDGRVCAEAVRSRRLNALGVCCFSLLISFSVNVWIFNGH
jgi:hypothetical protein